MPTLTLAMQGPAWTFFAGMMAWTIVIARRDDPRLFGQLLGCLGLLAVMADAMGVLP